jgi:hypothetical protein
MDELLSVDEAARIGARFRGLSHLVLVALYRVWVWSVAELDRLVLFDPSRHIFLSLSYCCSSVSSSVISPAFDEGEIALASDQSQP